MRVNLWSEWLRRIGAKTGDVAEWAPTVQPVVVLGDHRHHVAPLPEPWGLAGFQILNVLGQFSGYFLAPRTAGGLIIHWWTVFNGGGIAHDTSQRYRWAVVPPPTTTENNAAVAFDPSQPVAVNSGSRTNVGQYLVAPLVPGDAITFIGGYLFAANPQDMMPKPPPFRVPLGQAFMVEGNTTNQSLHGCVLFSQMRGAAA